MNATFGSTEAPPQESGVAASDFTESRSVQMPCHFLHSYMRNTDFSGREDILSQMDKTLLPDSFQGHQRSPAPRSFVISGLGGVGKTQCALEYAFSRKDSFDAVLWADADTAPKMDESFSQISVALGLELRAKAGDRVVSRNLVMEWLSDPVKGSQVARDDPTTERANWLLIFDNADNPEVLEDFWPNSGPGAILVTSRDPQARRLRSSIGVDLEPLTVQSAAALLRKLSDVDESPDEVDASVRVAKRMGGLPLAITLAAATILRQELLFDEFLDFYEAEPRAADIRPIFLRPENQYQHTLSTVWALDTFQSSAICLLRLLSVLDPDEIDEKIITQDMSTLPAGYPDSNTAFIEARTSLLTSSLVKRNKKSSSLSIHRLSQDFTRLKMSFEMLQEYFVTATRLCMRYWPKPVVAVSYGVKDWPACQAVVPHLLFLRGLCKKEPRLAEDPAVKLDLADLTWRVAWYFTERGSPAEDVEELLVSAHQICESEPSLRLTNTHSQALFSLSAIYGFENSPQLDLKYALLNLDIVKVMGIDPRENQLLGLAYNQVGYAFLCNDNWEEATQNFRNSIQVYSKWVEVTDRNFRPEFPWGGLAMALSEMGKQEEAAEIFLETIRHREKKFGPADTDSIKLGWAMQGLGSVRFKQGRLDESLEAYHKALANYRAISSRRYFRAGQVHVKLGQHYCLRRQFPDADWHYKEALMVFQDRVAYKGECARILHLQAKMHELIGDSVTVTAGLQSRAEVLYKEVVEGGKLSVYGASLDEVDFDKVVAMWAR
ncbi:hypothetical protein PV11_03835 [Exophiala sideris]|uniref:DUF7779 domain-containing protein n=1 Tax=Exophiala sideris TaxID=1016849 RepID=A0A0D1X2A8_9EURO|nr:hypothetical protein PV11_03835 [Exophiala sideris]